MVKWKKITKKRRVDDRRGIVAEGKRVRNHFKKGGAVGKGTKGSEVVGGSKGGEFWGAVEGELDRCSEA